MESLNLRKGYGKLENQNYEDHQTNNYYRQRKQLIITLTVSAILLLTLIIGLALAALIHESNETPESAESIETICHVTQYPTSCVSTLSSSLNSSSKTDPESLFNISLQVSIKELKNLTSFLNTLLASHDKGSSFSSSLKDCLDLFEDAMGKVQDSLTEMEKGLTPKKVNDIQTWISAALTDQETCLDGMQEMGGAGNNYKGEDFKSRMEVSKESLSNSLAIIAHMDALLEKFGLKMY